MLRSAGTWFVLLTTICVVAPYVLGVGPKTRRQWLAVVVTIAFLALMLPLMSSLRSR